jgi:uncharacterized protein DUF4349
MTSAEIIAELRASAPAAPDPLRDRVRTIVAADSAPRRRAFTRRRASFALVGGLAAAAVGAALVHGLASGGGGRGTEASQSFRSLKKAATATVAGSNHGARAHPSPLPPNASTATGLRPSQLPPAGLRLQDYQVSLGVRVENSEALSRATVQAMRWTRGHGGYVARVSYTTPGGRKGEADLVLRVPVTEVQDALQEFSSLGTLTSQHVSIQDLQGTVNAQTRRIIQLDRRIGAVSRALEGPLTVEQQARLQTELTARRQELAALTAAKQATVKQGRLARVYLSLDAAAKKKTVVPPARPGDIRRKLDDAGRVLAVELAVVLYGLVVLAPFAVLAAAAVLAARGLRRRSERRLLAGS